MPAPELSTRGELRRFIEAELRRPGAIPVVSSVALIKAGVPSDADFPNPPANGTLAINSLVPQLYARLGGAWEGL